MARGFSQVQGLEYKNTFYSIVKFNSIKLLVALATQYGLEIHQLDVKITFLYGNLKEEIFITLPKG